MAWYVHSRPVLALSTLPFVENRDKYVEITLSFTGSLYSSSYFSRMFVEVFTHWEEFIHNMPNFRTY